jgi:hypothetical protein
MSITFFIFLQKLKETSKNGCLDMGTPESKIFTSCWVMIFSFIWRIIAIIIEGLFWTLNNSNQSKQECNEQYYFLYFVNQILSEFLPLLFTGLIRIFQVVKCKKGDDLETGLHFSMG